MSFSVSLRVEHLTKKYGKYCALDDVSFSIDEGEIVGFLGPNGAGKSTTMKIITGYLEPSQGCVSVFGLDMLTQSLEIKRQMGYLPEHNPLYGDMYVIEYLRFVGGLYRLGKKVLMRRVDEMIDMYGLFPERHKKIGSLSKGYRQRVGLAQAFIHHPKVLILDEPMSGLDPNQRLDIRKAIKEISVNRIVMFSTHIMQEAVALCDRIIVLHQGKIIADDSLSHFTLNNMLEATFFAHFQEFIPEQTLKEVGGVKSVTILGGGRYRFNVDAKVYEEKKLLAYVRQKGYHLIDLKVDAHAMEAAFQKLTKGGDHD